MDPSNSAVHAMGSTGERMVPESSDPFTFWEHLFRYAYAARFVDGKDVLDIACGEGYGSAGLKAAGAASLIGVDIAQAACEHARAKYGVDARVGSAEEIPLPNQCVDRVVSFETIEHVPRPARFIDECYRVLRPGGQLIVSTPNKQVYDTLLAGEQNPFHCSELTPQEFTSLLSTKFKNIRLAGQRPINASRWTLRALASEKNPWSGIRGGERIRETFRRRLAPEAYSAPTPQQRSDVVSLINAYSGKRLNPFNPFVIRPLSTEDRKSSTYLVAVATRD